jgi:hypothetical protein
LGKGWWAPMGPGLHFGWLVRLDWEPFAGPRGSQETRRRRFGMLPSWLAMGSQGREPSAACDTCGQGFVTQASILRHVTAPAPKA